jgi:hypothetical protein
VNDQVRSDDVEGVEVGTGGGWGDYPLDAVFVRTEPRSVVEVVGRIEKKRYVLDPDFQRDFVWSNVKQSKLIESCVMRIPLPVFYVAEAPDGRIIVVDGLQRLTTFARYLGSQFRLTGLSSLRTRPVRMLLRASFLRSCPSIFRNASRIRHSHCIFWTPRHQIGLDSISSKGLTAVSH